MKKKGFTLIELIAVLVILAILALIVTPLVMNIIRKARESADKRSVDAYGRSVEIAIANYLLDEGKFPVSIEQLIIEYSGDRVECTTTQLNSDSSVYLAGCIVAGRRVEGYTYGNEETITYNAYNIGDEVTYNNVDYYVIKSSSSSDENLTMLKKEPLLASEVNQYGTGHVNRYTNYLQGTSTNPFNDYGFIAYYTSSTCNDSNQSGCTTDYNQSDIKCVVDAWAEDNVPSGLVEARLITLDDLTNNLGMEFTHPDATRMKIVSSEDTPMWIFGEGYDYWTSSSSEDIDNVIWVIKPYGFIETDGLFSTRPVYNLSPYVGTANPVLRPVITISKSAL